MRQLWNCEVSGIDACASQEYRMVVLEPVSGGFRTNGREVPPSGLKIKQPDLYGRSTTKQPDLYGRSTSAPVKAIE